MQFLRRGKTFKVISSNFSPELGDKSQSSPSLGTDISHQQTQPADKDPNNITDKEENKSLTTNSDMKIVSNESKTKQLSELKNQLNKTKQTLDMNTKLQRYVVHSFNYEI